MVDQTERTHRVVSRDSPLSCPRANLSSTVSADSAVVVVGAAVAVNVVLLVGAYFPSCLSG